MNEFNEPAYPWPEALKPGLTIRQQAALMMAQAVVYGWTEKMYTPRVADMAVELADAVLKREAETRGRSDE